MELWELAAREGIRDTIARYNHAGDGGRFDDMATCFTTDGELQIVPEPHIVGRAALRDFFGAVSPAVQGARKLTMLRHCVTNTLIEVQTPLEATARSYFQVLTDIGLDHWGSYRDRLVSDDASGRWLFATRSVKTDGYAEASYFRAIS